MPTQPPRACLTPGCSGFALPGKARCREHQIARVRAYEASRPRWLLAFYHSKEWTALSKRVRAEQPICNDCTWPSEQADHLISVRRRPDLALDRSNVVARCRRCHSAKTSREDSWNK